MPESNRELLRQRLASGDLGLHPLTFPQRELWETSPIPPGDPSNHICAVIRIRGMLTQKGSEAALQKVIDRQEVFRMSFPQSKDRPIQLVRKTGTPELRFHHLTSSRQAPEAIEEMAEEIFLQPFDLTQVPLYRAEVFRRSADDHVLVFAIHHAIADGWTLGVFVQDLFTAYLQGVRGDDAPLPPVPLPYTAWGEVERAFWSPVELETRATFWRSHLAQPQRIWAHPSRGRLQRFVTQIPPALGRGIKDLSRRNGATRFSTLLTAFQIALSRWTGANDIIVGTPVANRAQASVRETMGYCSGIVPLRGQVDQGRSFPDSLKLVHQTTLESFAQAMPFAELVKALPDGSIPGRNPVFEVRFALQNHPIPDVSVPGLSLQLRMRSTGTARFDLACEINEEGEAMEVAWLFPETAFDATEIDQVSRIYLAVLADACRLEERSPLLTFQTQP